NPVLSSDRLQVNWWVNHPTLVTRPEIDVANAALVNAVSFNDEGLLVPNEFRMVERDVVRFEIPMEFVPLERIDPDLGKRWRDMLRYAFVNLLSAGYIATDFARIENRVFYIFTRDDGSYTFQ